MRILAHALRARGGKPEVALWEEFPAGTIARPEAWIVTTLDRPDKEWRYEDEGQALHHFGQLKTARTMRAPGKYPAPKVDETPRLGL